MWVTKEGLKTTSQKKVVILFSNFCCLKLINPLHPEIILHLLYSFLYKFPMALEGEFVQQSMGFELGDHFLCSHDLSVSFRGDTVRRI